MKILNHDKGIEWLKTRSWDLLTPDTLEREFRRSMSYLLPADTGKKTHLARVLISSLHPNAEGLLWISGYGVWPSCENMDLFEGYRKSLGEDRPVREAPFHVFSKSESREVESLLALALYFYWDAVLLDGPRNAAVRVSHDEYVELYAPTDEGLSLLQNTLSDLALKQIA